MSETTQPKTPAVALEEFCTTFAEPTRWNIIRELTKGQALPVMELARRVGRTPAMTSKHLAWLRTRGVVVVCYGRLYQMAPAFQPKPGERVLDLGHCIMRLDAPL